MKALLLLCAGALALTPALIACDDDPEEATSGGPIEWTAGFDATSVGTLMSVWGRSADEVWAVGGQPDAGVIWRRNGDSWAPVSAPEGALLNWVHGAGDATWAVGNEGRALRRTADGAFEVTDTGVTGPLWGVWAASADEAWAVGGDALVPDGEADPIILHYQSGAWSRVPLPELDRETPKALFKVWGTSANQVIAVGSRGVILHYDGEGWRQESSGTGKDLISLWGTGPDDIAVVGGRSGGLLSRWNGETWETRDLAGLPGLNGIHMNASGEAVVVGVRGAAARVPAGSFEYERDRTSTLLVLHAVWGLPGRPVFAVGGSLDAPPPWEGVALEGN